MIRLVGHRSLEHAPRKDTSREDREKEEKEDSKSKINPADLDIPELQAGVLSDGHVVEAIALVRLHACVVNIVNCHSVIAENQD